MKKILVCGVLFGLLSSTLHAQLTDTKWKNFMNIPVSKDTLRLTKLTGMSPCTENITGLYRIEIKDEKLTITLISDDCTERANAFKPEAWKKEKIN